MIRILPTPKNEGSWECKFCGYTSMRITDVKRHVQRTHAKKENLPCPGCATILTNKCKFNRHLDRRHPELANLEISRYDLEKIIVDEN